MDVIRAILVEPHTGLYELGSVRTGSPLPIYLWPSVVLAVVLAYLLTVKIVLPAYMHNRKPYNLRTFMLVYNVLQVAANVYMFKNLLSSLVQQGDFLVSSCVISTPALVQLNLLWLLNKFSDFIETGVFVLRHKGSQVTFLHVYHHVCVVYYAYIAFLDAPGGYSVFVMMENAAIHAVMYGYYFASIYDRRIVQHLQNFKQRLTQVQMIQFAINFLYYGRAVVGLCKYTQSIAIAGCVQSLVMFVLFGNFYYHAYIKKRSPVKTN